MIARIARHHLTGTAASESDRAYKPGDIGWWNTQDEEKGHFEFQHVRPGQYIIVFHNSNRPDPDMPYPRRSTLFSIRVGFDLSVASTH